MPSGSVQASTRARFCASSRRRRTASGSSARIAFVTAWRSSPVVCPAAPGSTCASTAAACSPLSGATASRMTSALRRSIRPVSSAAAVAGRRASCSARPTWVSAATWVKVSAIATSSARNSLSRTGNCPGAGAGVRSAGRRRASSAIAASARACAHDVCRHQPAQHPDELIVADLRQPGVRVVGEPGQRHPRDQHVQRAAVGEPGPAAGPVPGQHPAGSASGTGAGAAASSCSSSGPVSPASSAGRPVSGSGQDA